MTGRRGVIIDVDPEMRADAQWKVEVWKSQGLWKELKLVPCDEKDIAGTAEDQSGCVWASDVSMERRSSSPMITGIVPRHNFDQFHIAIITTFQILTMENYNDNLSDMWASMELV